ncbi:UNKNOWN [Stylonychia lemnae]|uniref:Uncharacterized protein n=1 Tax=Stylonychia lemnae TaxID=5949 RepID=A0A078BBF1_STYLE|nr:UNKNOWN [Stylonychia lemnae]|eukprot:CDW91729.1 UNKNOWN [Stylonychia lemnae]
MKQNASALKAQSTLSVAGQNQQQNSHSRKPSSQQTVISQQIQTHQDHSSQTKLPPREIINFDIETTIREISCKVMSEYIDRAKRNEDRFIEMKDQNVMIIKRFNELDFIMHKTLQRSGNISDLQQDMLELKQLFSVQEARVQQSHSEMRTALQVNNERLTIAEEQIFQYEKRFQRFQEYTEEVINRNSKLKNDIEERLNDQKRTLMNQQNQMEFKLMRQQESFSQINGSLQSHLEELKRHEAIIEIFKRNIKELYDSEMSLLDKKLDVDQFAQSFDIFKKDLQFLRVQIDDNTMTLKQTDNYVEKYLPIKVQNFITETLTNILPKKALQKLNDFIHHKYRLLRDVVENDNGTPELNKIEYSIPMIRKIELMIQKNAGGIMSHNFMHQNSKAESHYDNHKSVESFFDDSEKNSKKGYGHHFRRDGTIEMINEEGSKTSQVNGAKSISGLSGIHEFNKDNSSENNTMQGMENIAVKKKSYMIYYPELTEDQHMGVINIRLDPKTNFVPVMTGSREQNTQEEFYESDLSPGRGLEGNFKSLQMPLPNVIPSSPQQQMKLTSENLKNLSSIKQTLQVTNIHAFQQLNRSSSGPKSSCSRRLTEQKRPGTLLIKQPSLMRSVTRKISPKKTVKIMKIEIEENANNGSSLSPLKRTKDKNNLRSNLIRVDDGGKTKDKKQVMIKRESSNLYQQNQSNINEDDEDAFDDDDYERNKLSVSSSSTDRKLIKLTHLDKTLKDMIIESFEAAKQFKEIGAKGLERLEQAESKMKDAIDDNVDELQNLVSKEIAKIQITSSNIQKDAEDELKRRIRDKTDFDLKIKIMQDQLDKAKQSFKLIKNFTESIAQLTQNLAESIKIILKLGEQDEEDRKSISLIGYKSQSDQEKHAHNQQQQTTQAQLSPNQHLNHQDKVAVTLDKQCLSCSGQASIVINAFKMACLSYSPQPVTYNSITCSRESLYRNTLQLVNDASARFLEWRRLQSENKLQAATVEFASINDMQKMNSNNTQATLTTYDEFLSGQDRTMTKNPSEKFQSININNFDIKANVVNLDCIAKKHTNLRAKTTSRAGARNIQMSAFSSYQREAPQNQIKPTGLVPTDRPQTTAFISDHSQIRANTFRGIPALGTSLSLKSNATNSTIGNPYLTARASTLLYNEDSNENSQSNVMNQVIQHRFQTGGSKTPRNFAYPMISQMNILQRADESKDKLQLQEVLNAQKYSKKPIPIIKIPQTARQPNNTNLIKCEDGHDSKQGEQQQIIKFVQPLQVQEKSEKSEKKSILKKLK